jgi:hypothetical protein
MISDQLITSLSTQTLVGFKGKLSGALCGSMRAH